MSSKSKKTIIGTAARMRITGSEQEIEMVLEALKAIGFKYRTNQKLQQCPDDPKQFSLYLNCLRVPSIALSSPAPRRQETGS